MKNSSRAFVKLSMGIIAILWGMGVAYSQEIETLATGGTLPDSNNFEARGLVRSAAKIEIRSNINAPIASAPFLEGMSFNKGDTLIKFNCSQYSAQLKAARASANAAWIEHSTKKRLLKHQAVGKNEVRLAAAKASEANAMLDMQKVKNAHCKVAAPFSGRVVELNAKKHELPSRDRPLLIILDDNNLMLEMVVPSKWLAWIRVKTPFQFFIDETQQTISANIVRMGAEIDPVSQTISIIGKLNNQGALVLPGMSGTAIFAGGA